MSTLLERWQYYSDHRLWWWQRRRPVAEFDTRIYVGRPGSGKTLFVVRDGVELLRQGVRVAANIKVRDPFSGRESEPIHSWLDFLRLAVDAIITGEPIVFLIDEINQWAPARFWNKVPGWWLTLMSQRRHFGVGIIASAQNYEGVEAYLRRLVNSIVFLKKLNIKVPVYDRGSIVMVPLPWFRAAALDPQDAETAMAVSTDAAGARQRGRLPAGDFVHMPAWVYNSYSTAEVVAVEEWHEDEDVAAEVADLMDEAHARNKLIYLPAIGEDPAWISDVLETCGLCPHLVDCDATRWVCMGLASCIYSGALVVGREGGPAEGDDGEGESRESA